MFHADKKKSIRQLHKCFPFLERALRSRVDPGVILSSGKLNVYCHLVVKCEHLKSFFHPSSPTFATFLFFLLTNPLCSKKLMEDYQQHDAFEKGNNMSCERMEIGLTWQTSLITLKNVGTKTKKVLKTSKMLRYLDFILCCYFILLLHFGGKYLFDNRGFQLLCRFT